MSDGGLARADTSGSTSGFGPSWDSPIQGCMGAEPTIHCGRGTCYGTSGDDVIQGTSGADLITNERRIQTKVLAQDGQVVVLGGLIKDDVQDGTQKVPILGDIPFIGRLFRTDSVSVTKNNLLVFLRSTIIRDSEALSGATAEKYRYIQAQQVERRERGLMFLDDDNLPVLPEWEEQIKLLEDIAEEELGPLEVEATE